MGLFGGGSKPPAIPPTPPAANPPTEANANAQNAGATQRTNAAAAAGLGFSNTITTSPEGLVPTGNVAQKSLLGQ